MSEVLNINKEKEKKEKLKLTKQLDQLVDIMSDAEEDSIYSVLATMMDMDDESFNVIKEQVLISIEDTLNKNKEIVQYINQENKYDFNNIELTIKSIKEEIEESDFSETKKDFLLKFTLLIFNAIIKNDDPSNHYVSIPCELCKEIALPHYANDGDAGMDLYSPEEYTIKPGETIIIPTGLKVAIPQGYALLIQPRSGQSVKTKLRVANTPGLIDSGYRDEIGVIVENIEPPFKDIDYDFNENGTIKINSILHGNTYTIAKGQRFAQMRLVKAPKAAFFEVDNIKEIKGDRGGGFGSSGTN